MKPYMYHHQVRSGSQVFGYTFMFKTNEPRFYRHEMTKMKKCLEKEVKKKGWYVEDMICYAELVEDRRSDKMIPKGYKRHHYMYAHKLNTWPRGWRHV